jgi:PAS domain S-box-containing protein
MPPGNARRLLPRGIRARLLLAFGAGIVILFCVMGATVYFGLPFGILRGDYQAREAEALDRLKGIADVKKSAIVQWIEEKRGDLAACALDPRLGEFARSLKGPHPRGGYRRTELGGRLSEWLSTVKEIRNLDGIGIVDAATGTCLLSTDPEEAAGSLPCAAALIRGESDWTDKVLFTTGEDLTRTFMLFARRLDSTAPGASSPVVLVFRIAMEDSGLTEILHGSDLLGESGEIVLFDMQKTLLAPLKHPLPDGSAARPLRYMLKTAAADYATWGNETVLRSVDYRGVPVMAAIRHYRVTPDFGLGIVVKQDEREFMAPFRRSVAAAAAIVFAGMIVLIGLLALLARRLLSPLERLTEAAHRIEAGDIDARARIDRDDEIGDLSRSFDAMADRIREWYEALESTVRQRTANLSEANRLLSQANEYTENLIRAANVIIVGMDAAGRVTLMNRTAEEATGYSQAELLGKDWVGTMVPETEKSGAAEALGAVLAGIPGNHENRIATKGGGSRIISWSNSPVLEQGRVAGTISFGIDVTEQRRLEMHLLDARKMEAVGRLAGGVAHDFNNQLTVILGYLELVLSRISPEDRNREYLLQVMKAAESARDLTRQLLAFSRRQVVSPKPVDINALIRTTGKNLARLIGEDVRLDILPCDDPWPILIDPSQFEQLVMNLAVNARDAMPDGGRLAIGTRNLSIREVSTLEEAGIPPGDYVELCVSDTGGGMDPETLSHVFEPFFTTKEIGKGTGLGLATVYGIVTQNGGFIDVRSERGSGTTFRIRFPRIGAAPAAPSDQPTIAAIPAGSGVVLLVEDEEPVREMTSRMLESMGYSVVAARTPHEAIGMCGDPGCRVDLVLTDVIMPEMSGRELGDRLKALRPGIRLLYMSGYTADIVARRGILDGEMHFLQKPFDRLGLDGAIRKLLADSAPD